MNMSSSYMRNMLCQYSRQLVVSRRLARYHHLLYQGMEQKISPQRRRRLIVERVAREIFENFLFTGSQSPVLDETRKELARAVGEDIIFHYPPGKLDLSISRTGPNGTVELTGSDKAKILSQVWKIILSRVEATIL